MLKRYFGLICHHRQECRSSFRFDLHILQVGHHTFFAQCESQLRQMMFTGTLSTHMSLCLHIIGALGSQNSQNRIKTRDRLNLCGCPPHGAHTPGGGRVAAAAAAEGWDR